MNSSNVIIVLTVVVAVALARPQLIPGAIAPNLFARPFVPQRPGFGFANLASGSASGAGTGNAGPGGVSASGVAISSAVNGGSSVASGTGTASENFFTGQATATGTGTGQSTGK